MKHAIVAAAAGTGDMQVCTSQITLFWAKSQQGAYLDCIQLTTVKAKTSLGKLWLRLADSPALLAVPECRGRYTFTTVVWKN